MKSLKWLALAGLVCALAAGAAQADELPFLKNASGHHKPFTIGVSNGFIGNAWRAQFVTDIEKVAAELKASGDFADVVITNSTSGANGQISQINSLLSRKVDALVVNPVSGEALKPVLERAVSSGVLVVIGDDPLDMPDVLAVTLDHKQYWGVETQWLVDELGGKGNIVAIEGLAGNTANDLRVQGRDAVLAKYPGIKLLASVPGQWDEATAREAMTGLFAAHDNIDGVLIQEVEPDGVVRAFTAANKPLVPLTGDYVHSYLKYWKDNSALKSVVVTNPPGIGADSLIIAAELLRGHQLKSDAVTPNPLNSSHRNTILVSEPFVISREGGSNKPWCTQTTKCISLDEALAQLKGQPDSASVDGYLTAKEALDVYFTK